MFVRGKRNNKQFRKSAIIISIRFEESDNFHGLSTFTALVGVNTFKKKKNLKPEIIM